MPTIRLHKASQQFYVWDSLTKKRVYLGTDLDQAKVRLDRFRKGEPLEEQRKKREEVSGGSLSVNELLVRYVKHRRSEGRDRRAMGRLFAAVRFAKDLYGLEPACSFRGPSLLRVRDAMLAVKSRRKATKRKKNFRRHVTAQSLASLPLSRGYVNEMIGQLKMCWQWAAERDLVPTETLASLRSVSNIRKGRGGRESRRITSVEAWAVEATLPWLNPTVAAMVRIQELAGFRPGELCGLRRRDVSTSVSERVPLPETDRDLAAFAVDGVLVWIAVPQSHKNAWRGKPRAVAIAPKARAILAPFLVGKGPDEYLFSAREACDEWRLRNGRIAKYGKGREPGECYSTESYGRAIAYAIERANRERCRLDPPERMIPPWRPNQLRHRAASEASEATDRSHAAAMLGHSGVDLVDVYVDQELRKAARAAIAIG